MWSVQGVVLYSNQCKVSAAEAINIYIYIYIFVRHSPELLKEKKITLLLGLTRSALGPCRQPRVEIGRRFHASSMGKVLSCSVVKTIEFFCSGYEGRFLSRGCEDGV